MSGTADFSDFGNLLSNQRADYVYRSTPRTAVGHGVFTATEYPASENIPLHSENAYQDVRPSTLAFWCKKAAASGGQTPVASLDAVSQDLSASTLEAFATRGVRYIRHYRPFVDLDWRTVFQTSDRSEVGRYCESHRISCQWLEGDVLRTEQRCSGTIRASDGSHLFFNQAHLFHPSALPAEVELALREMYGTALPRNAVFGDGGDIPHRMLEEVRSAFSRRELLFNWADDDILVLDNFRFAHGRRSFTGERNVFALLLDPVSDPDAS